MSLRDRLTAFFAPKSSAPATAIEAATPRPGLAFTDSVWDRNLVPSGEKITPGQLVMWLKSAEAGETGQLHAFYDEMRARIPDIEVETGKAESRIAGGKVQILPWPPALRSRTQTATGDAAIAAEVAAYCAEVTLAPHVRLDKAVVALSQGFWKGIGAVAPKVVPDPVDPGKERIVELKPIPAQRFRWESDSTRLLLQIGDQREEVIDAAVAVAMGDLLILQTDEHIPSPARRGLFRRLYALAIGLMYGPGWWTRFLELYGVPIRVGHHPRGDEQARAQLIEGLKSMGAEGFAALPEGSKLEILSEVARSGSSEVHQAFAEFAARTIAKLVNGASQATDIQQGTGSRASAGVHENVTDERHRDRAREVAAVLRAGLYHGLVARRFGWEVAEKHTPEILIDVDPRPDLLELATGLKTLVEAGAGEVIPLSIVNDRGGIPVPEKGEKTFGPAPAPKTAPAGPTGSAGEPDDDEEGDPAAEGDEAPTGAQKAKPPRPPKKGGVSEEEAAARPGKPRRDPAAELQALEAFADRQAALFGYELVEPIRRIVSEAEREDWTLEQTFAAVMARLDLPADSPKLIDALAAVQLEAVMRGITSERNRVRVS